MAKKKKTPAAKIEPVAVSDEDLSRARAWLEGLNADIAYAQAKRQLAQACGWERSKANAVVVALHEAGFMAGDKNYFSNPNAPAEPGVVRGAREASNFTVMLQSDPDVSLPVPFSIHCLPGDVFTLRRTSLRRLARVGLCCAPSDAMGMQASGAHPSRSAHGGCPSCSCQWLCARRDADGSCRCARRDGS